VTKVFLVGDIVRDLDQVLSGFKAFGIIKTLPEEYATPHARHYNDACALGMLDVVMIHAPAHLHQLEPTGEYLSNLVWLAYRVLVGGGTLQLGPYLINAHPCVAPGKPVVVARLLLHIPSLN